MLNYKVAPTRKHFQLEIVEEIKLSIELWITLA